MMPPSPQHIAFDLGASSGRVLLGTLDGGRMHLDDVHRFETPLIEAGKRLYWDLEALDEQLVIGLEQGMAAAPHLQSLSVDAWGVDYVPLGEDGHPLRNPHCYRDPRTHAVMEAALKRVSRTEIYATTGIQFIPINTLYQVLADQQMEPERVARTTQRLMMADYVHYRFCGRAVAEQSMASTTQLMNVRTQTWATDLMERFDINPSTWPEIVPPATTLGPLIRNGTATDIDVIAGCSHDTACAVAAVPAESDGSPWAYISCGTWSLLGVERTDPVLTDAAREASFTNEIGLDGTVRFLKNLTGLWVLQECERAWAADGQTFDYDLLQREAEAADPMEPVNLDDPRFVERGRMPQKLQAYCREHDQPVPTSRGAFVRLVLESLAADYRDKLAVLEDVIGTRIEKVHLVGGGAQNELLCQWTADATGRRVIAGPAEATALGNLLIQARVMGTLPDGATIRDVVRASTDLRVYDPAESDPAESPG